LAGLFVSGGSAFSVYPEAKRGIPITTKIPEFAAFEDPAPASRGACRGFAANGFALSVFTLWFFALAVAFVFPKRDFLRAISASPCRSLPSRCKPKGGDLLVVALLLLENIFLSASKSLKN
jgi:hypothetical protein